MNNVFWSYLLPFHSLTLPRPHLTLPRPPPLTLPRLHLILPRPHLTLPRPHLTLPISVSSFLSPNTPQSPICVAQILTSVGSSPRAMPTYQRATLLKKKVSLPPQKPSLGYISTAGAGGLWVSPTSCCILTGLNVSRPPQLLGVPECNILSYPEDAVYSSPIALTDFLLPLQKWSLSLGVRTYNRDVSFCVWVLPRHPPLPTRCDQSCASVSITIHCRQKLDQWGMRDNLWVERHE